MHVMLTDYGVYPLPRSVAAVMDAAKVRRDGDYDMRTAAGRFMRHYERSANKIAEVAYVKGVEPVMPDANDV